MNNVHLLTPIQGYEAVDWVFDFGQKKFEVWKRDGARVHLGVLRERNEQPGLIKTLIKVVLLSSLLFPLIALIIKLAVRNNKDFHILNTSARNGPSVEGLRKWANGDAERLCVAYKILWCYIKENQTLSLENHSLTSLPPEIGKLKQLRSLSLDHNKLTSLPPEIGKLKHLRSLSLCRNQLKSLPEEIGHLNQLETLILDHNKLTSLPPEIGELKQLSLLFLPHNQLESLPEGIGDLNQLETLILDHNELTSLPPEIGELKQLRRLSLDHNKLTSLPPEIGELKQLRLLSLDHNQLKSLPEEIGHLDQLETLDLYENQCTSLPLSVIALPQAKTIYLHKNQIPQNLLTFYVEIFTWRFQQKWNMESPAETKTRLEKDAQARKNLCMPNSRALDALFQELEMLRLKHMASLQNPSDHSIDVHEGSAWEKPESRAAFAIRALRIIQADKTQKEWEKAATECAQYIQNLPEGEKKTNALLALYKRKISPDIRGFAPLLEPSQQIDLNISRGYFVISTGMEFIGRTWLFITQCLKDKDQEQAQDSLITALSDSIEGDQRVCNPGKVSRITASVIEGYFPGFDNPHVSHVEQSSPMTGKDAIKAFFEITKHQKIREPQELLQTAMGWVNEQPRPIEKKSFLKEMVGYIQEGFG